MTAPRATGFTLLELIVAVAIFAVVSVVAYSGLQRVLLSQERVRTETEQLAALQTAFSILGRDLRSIAQRGYRDSLGDAQPSLHRDGERLVLVRGGRRNPLDLPRSSFQRLAYAVEDGSLVRYSYRAVDSSFEPQPRRSVLLEEVTSIEFRFYVNGGWQNRWPPAGSIAENAASLPRAVAVRLTHGAYGELQRSFRVPGRG